MYIVLFVFLMFLFSPTHRQVFLHQTMVFKHLKLTNVIVILTVLKENEYVNTSM